jgi:hypothetical protein
MMAGWLVAVRANNYFSDIKTLILPRAQLSL